MDKTRALCFGLAIGFTVGLFIGIFISYDKGRERAFALSQTNHSWGMDRVKSEIAECEAELPRNQHCDWKAVAYVVEEKSDG